IDVIEEYTRPARYVENGNIVTREALSDAELIQFDGIGTLESWNSDGLRSLIQTMKIPNMIEKTLRYPGTIQYLKVLRESGFFSYKETEINGVKIRPIDLTAKLLFPKWKLKPGEEDYTIMRITIEGEYKNKPKTFIYNLLDNYEKSTGTISMARTTGYTCNAVANLILDNSYTEKGVVPPEKAGENSDNFRSILKYLWERDVNYHITEE
ncbi:MAG: saccharopine dehydrogenase, partial [Bacteroidetes bacterium]